MFQLLLFSPKKLFYKPTPAHKIQGFDLLSQTTKKVIVCVRY